MQALCEDVSRLKTNAPPPRVSPVVMSRSSDQDAAQRILGTSWAEEMDILNPNLDDQPHGYMFCCTFKASQVSKTLFTILHHNLMLSISNVDGLE